MVSIAHTFQPSLHACLKEGSPFIDFRERSECLRGLGYWLILCCEGAVPNGSSLSQTFVDKGVDIAEVDVHGFNCLFVFMSRANEPSNAQEFKALQHLLTVFHDIHALDKLGNTIFTYVNELRNWPGLDGVLLHDCGSYRQDLWYRALAVSELEVCRNVQPCMRLARYTKRYTPKHYAALCHLQDWDSWDWGKNETFEPQIQSVLREHPLSDDEECIQLYLESARWPWDMTLDSEGLSKLRLRRSFLNNGERVNRR